MSLKLNSEELICCGRSCELHLLQVKGVLMSDFIKLIIESCERRICLSKEDKRILVRLLEPIDIKRQESTLNILNA